MRPQVKHGPIAIRNPFVMKLSYFHRFLQAPLDISQKREKSQNIVITGPSQGPPFGDPERAHPRIRRTKPAGTAFGRKKNANFTGSRSDGSQRTLCRIEPQPLPNWSTQRSQAIRLRKSPPPGRRRSESTSTEQWRLTRAPQGKWLLRS